MKNMYKQVQAFLFIFFVFSINAWAQQPALLIQRIFSNPSGNDSPNEFVELVATRSINFSAEPYTVVFVDGSVATAANGWKSGDAGSYGFEITSGNIGQGDIVYVGGTGLGTYINGGASCKILRQINTGTTSGDGFGTPASGGVLGNGGSNADGVGIFNMAPASIAISTVPVDAVFFGTAIGSAASKFPVPDNDLYDGGLFGSAGSTFLAPDPASNEYIYVAAGTFYINNFSWGTARAWGTTTTKPTCTNPPVISFQTDNGLSFTFNPIATGPYIQPAYISGVINDPTDPAKIDGIIAEVKEAGVPVDAANYTITASSSKTSVVTNANIIITKADGQATIKITPTGVGYSTITLTLTKGIDSKTLSINYAASAASATPAGTYWHTGISDASDGIPLDDDYFVTGDDEQNSIYVHSRKRSGLPLASFNYGNNLALPDGAATEVDIEAAAKSTTISGRIYWIGSMSNGKEPDFDSKPNRNRLFATSISGTGAATSLSFVGYYGNLRARLISWGDANGYNFSSSAAAGEDSKSAAGFAAEGMVFAPDNTTLYIGLRAPLVPTANRTKAVIAPITAFETWFNNGSASGNPAIGAPIELDLGSRGIRDLVKLSNGTYIIVAGNPAGSPVTSALYKWTGNAADAPVLLNISAVNGLNLEGAMEINEGGQLALDKLQLISDNGTEDFYNDGTEAKDLSQNNFKKYRSDIIISPLIGTIPVRYEYFTADKNNNNVKLSWKTGRVDGISTFEIMRSANGRDFTSIASMDASTGKTVYTYTDQRSNETKLYYRIKAIEQNGSNYFTTIRLVNFGTTKSVVNIYPNPVKEGKFTATVNTASQKELKVYDVAGRLYKKYSFNSSAIDITTGDWAKGYYLIRICNAINQVLGIEKLLITE